MKKEKEKIENWEKEFVEKGADLEHKRWAGWQSYLFSKSEWTKNGYLIPKELCFRWQKQIDTPYSKLSEERKESDRIEVRKYVPLIRQLLIQEKTKNCQKFIDALIWCSGSDDFQVGGKARKGWEKICLPLLKKDERN